MEFLDSQSNIFVLILDFYFLTTIVFGMVMLFVFVIFSEETRVVPVYVGVFTILHIVGLNFRLILL